ncbi:membrane-associated oxidoreductase [Pseudomonas capsici]|uniref:Membrane-associated oxidoreductase n=1 Tax=Pseudomonas capsici TaxID=2810614 RepID=A0ABT3BXN8_9PSED|nr:membrane-associated oxidoreductase [Pseudomonas capsici]MCV4268894.1 membrane-associated oxidoreductase [Pseudomonas capsici]MCV4279169.1 membrane-associated oxidoreductase [Pseudomonas capsici]MCV4332619.1 membrane-associated oxidoreductase [Pseudomonas capsici]MCV4377613.1 membrane-associated oxidoreductase [Pseudomonas capsici]
MKPYGRSLTDFGSLWPAELQLLEHCKVGTEAKVGLKLPLEPSDSNRVRAEFIRFLALGGDEQAPVHEHGVQLRGAYVEGKLNLQSTTVPVALLLRFCAFERLLGLMDASLSNSLLLYGSSFKGVDAARVKIAGVLSLKKVISVGRVNLDGADIKGQITFSEASLDGKGGWALSAENIVCQGSLHLGGVKTNGMISLLASRIGGGITCDRACFSVSEGPAFAADRTIVDGSVFMRDGFLAKGGVRFLGAKVHGQFNCIGGEFEGGKSDALAMDGAFVGGSLFLGRGFKARGAVALRGVVLKGDLVIREAEQVTELKAQRINIEGSLILRNLVAPIGKASFTGARAGALSDDSKSWGDDLDINGFVYNFIHINEQTSISDRLHWLDKQRVPSTKPGQLPEFYPQPWRQLQKVLNEMGHVEEARQVGVTFEDRLREKGLVGQSPAHWPEPMRNAYRRLMVFLHWVYRPLGGYGYRPMLLLPWFLGVWLLCAAVYWWAADQKAIFAPSDPLVFQNASYKHCSPPLEPTGNEPAGTGNWYLCDALPQEYTAFSPIAFSLDLLLPLVNLHQEDDWAPVIDTPKANALDEFFSFFTSPKRWVRFVMWLEIIFGWIFSLLFVAVVSGQAQRKE